MSEVKTKYCMHCGLPILKEATICQTCGKSQKIERGSLSGRQKLGLLLGVLILILVSLSAAALFSQTMTPQFQQPAMSVSEIKTRAIAVSYDDLFRYNERYRGMIIHFKGQIIQALYGSGDYHTLRIATNQSQFGGWYDDVVLVHYNGPRVIEKDVVEIWGRVKGLITYKSILNQDITIPEIESLHLERLQG